MSNRTLHLPEQPEAAAGGSEDPVMDGYGITHFLGKDYFQFAGTGRIVNSQNYEHTLSIMPVDIQ